MTPATDFERLLWAFEEGVRHGDSYKARAAVVFLYEHVWGLYKMADAQAQLLRARPRGV